MTAPIEDHLTFWRTLRRGLHEEKKSVVEALVQARAEMVGSPFEDVAESMVRQIRSGHALSDAMAEHTSLFSRAIHTMVRAGEAGAVLGVIASRIVDGLEDGSFVVPGAAAAEGSGLVRFWRGLGRLTSSGVPILETFDVLSEEIPEEPLLEAIREIRQTVLDGGFMADAMRRLPDLFADEVCAAIESGESHGDLDVQAFRVADALDAGDLRSLVEESEQVRAARDAAVEASLPVRIVQRIIKEALERRATDIHLDALEGGKGRVRLRVDGVLHDIEPLPGGLVPKVVNRIKIMSEMDIAERRRPQDGRIMIKTVHEGKVDLRVSVMPTMWGQRVVVRVLHCDAMSFGLNDIGLSEVHLQQVRELCLLPGGLVIVNGPAGSGKTTLLYSMLMEIDRDKKCVITIEDPIEYSLEGVAHSAILPTVGLTFQRAMIGVLRQAPDVVMVGEIRDVETAQLVVRAALIGHLLFTTLHAYTSPGAVMRLLDMGVEPFMIGASLAGVVSTRLVRTLCPKCKRQTARDLESLPPDAAECVRQSGVDTFHTAGGCDHCNHTGYRGRTTVHEVLVPDDAFRRALARSADVADLREAAAASGMKPMIQDGIDKAARGITSVEEVCRVMPRGPNV